MNDFEIRLANLNDIKQIKELIKRSAIELSKGFYSEEEITALNNYVFGVDSTLIKDGTYYVAERNGVIIACGGWSKRRTIFGGDQFAHRDDDLLSPGLDAAKLRAFFCEPDFAKQGVSKDLLLKAVADLYECGFTKVEGYSTLTGLGFYSKLGGDQKCIIEYPLPNGMKVKLIHMEKTIEKPMVKLRPRL